MLSPPTTAAMLILRFLTWLDSPMQAASFAFLAFLAALAPSSGIQEQISNHAFNDSVYIVLLVW